MTLKNNKFLQKFDVILKNEIRHAIESSIFPPCFKRPIQNWYLAIWKTKKFFFKL